MKDFVNHELEIVFKHGQDYELWTMNYKIIDSSQLRSFTVV